MPDVPNEPPEAAPDEAQEGRRGKGGVRHLSSVRRVPPHDLDAEQALLSCVLTRPVDCWPHASTLESSAFYAPAHQHIHAAMATVVADAGTIDVITVADRLRKMGLLEGLELPGDHVKGSGTAALMGLLALTWPHTTKADAYAATIESQARARRLVVALGNATDAAWAGDLEGAMPAVERAEQELAAVAGAARSWEPVDLAGLLANGLTPVVPLLLARTDGECLLYPGRVHAFNAESESGKSWLAKLVCAEQLGFGESVLYLDFETDPEGVAERMMALGVDTDVLGSRFVYVRPDDPFDLAARGRLQQLVTEHSPTIAIIDGVAEVLGMNDWDENIASDYARFLNVLPRMLERAGVTVVLIDHVTKDPKSRMKGGRGTGHKLAGITASFSLEVAQPFARGRTGRARVRIEKDRIGWLRSIAGAGTKPVIAEFELASSEGGTPVVGSLRPPPTTESGEGSFDEFRPTGYMERISRQLETTDEPLSVNAIRRLVNGKARVKDVALACLVEEGYVAVEPGPRNSILHVSVRPFREHDPVDNEPDAILEEPF